MDVYSRKLPTGERVWYVDARYWEGGKRRRSRRSTGIRDDGTTKSRRTAEIVARDIEQSLALGTNRVARKTTLTQAIDKLIEQKEMAGRSQKTIDIILEKSVHLFDFFGADTPVEQATNVDGYCKVMIGARKSQTIARELLVLCQAFRAVGLTPPKTPELAKPDKRERFLTPAEQLKLLAATPQKYKDYIVMYLHLGLSLSELYRIEHGDCDFDRREVRVRGTKTDKRDRFIPMSPEVFDILWLRRDQRPLFHRWHTGAHMSLRAWSARASIGPISFNDLRRTFATTLAARGVPILHLMHLMGHSSTKMLEQVYARVGQGAHMHEAITKLVPLRKREPAKKEA